MEKKDEKVQLTKGSKYLVTSLGTKDNPIVTVGIFKGYTLVGNLDALVMELEGKGADKAMKGKLRVVPSHMVLAIDILKAVNREDKKAGEEKQVSYL